MIDCGVMLFSRVVGVLLGAAAIGFADGLAHRIRHAVGVENRAAFDVAGAAAHGLNQRRGAAQIAFLVRIENGHQRNFRQIEAFAQQVDADQHVEFAAAQIAQNAHALERFNFGVQIAAAHADFGEIFGQVLGHALGQRGDQHALVARGAHANFFEQIVHLPFHRAHFHLRIDQPRGANHLLDDDAAGFRELVGAGRGGNVDRPDSCGARTPRR